MISDLVVSVCSTSAFIYTLDRRIIEFFVLKYTNKEITSYLNTKLAEFIALSFDGCALGSKNFNFFLHSIDKVIISRTSCGS